MPYRQEWFDAPKNMNLPVVKDVPQNVSETMLQLIHGMREASGYVGETYLTFHFCRHCDGWIEGYANQFEVNNLSPHQLAGRKGTEYFCRRCGREIGFFGMMS